MHVRSSRMPPPHAIPATINTRVADFTARLNTYFENDMGDPISYPTNQFFKHNINSWWCNAIKTWDPPSSQYRKYIKLAFRDHLNDNSSYQHLSTMEKMFARGQIKIALTKWIKDHKNELSKGELKYLHHHLKNNRNPLPLFYLTMKVHKTPLRTRPIVSCCGSLLEGLGHWIDSNCNR